MLPRAETYDALVQGFSWSIPHPCNMGAEVCDRHAHGSPRPALIVENEDGEVRTYTFHDLARLTNRLANVFEGMGLKRGDRVAVLLPQSLEVALTHIAAFKAGLISVPLFALFGEEALRFRLADSGCRLLVTDREGLAKIAPLRPSLPALQTVLCTEGKETGAEDFHALLARAADTYTPLATGADDPAIIIYTSGTTGQPKGALHGQRILLGHLPGVELTHDFFPQAGDRFWTPADWAWIGGLFDVLLPALYHGVAVVARRFPKFDPERAMALMARHEVRNVFLPPTALKLMRQAGVAARGVRLRSLASGGESLGEELLEWGRATFGLTINEFYGQTECNIVVGNCSSLFPVRPGAMGRAIPGHEVAVIDPASGTPLSEGALGVIGIRRPDPVMFLEYWNNPAATAQKFAGEWLLTGDLGRQDGEGYFWYVGREDDVITSGGYRIGPGEIEECLLKHPAVALAAAVGVPDPVRTEVVGAFVVLREGYTPSASLAAELQDFVRKRLGAHEYPRIVRFERELPLTATGKIMRRVLREKALSPPGPPSG
jgi:acetyl-CoA synthetase